MTSVLSTLRTRLSLLLVLCAASTPLLAKPYACLQTNVGEFCMELFPDKAPVTVANFLAYVDDGTYADSWVHRSVPGFVIQGGGYRVYSNLIATLPVRSPIVNEYNQSNLRGTVAMARLGGQPNSATSQWFVNLADNTSLNTVDGGFTVFGKIVKGMDVVDSIAALNRLDLTTTYGAAFSTVPSTVPAGGSLTDNTQLIRVVRAYRSDTLPGLLPYQCSLTSPGDTLTEFCGSSMSFPVAVGTTLFEVTLNYLPGKAGFVFALDPTQLKVISDTGQPRATFDGAGVTIPSVRVAASAYNNVHLKLSNPATFEFTLDAATPR